MKRSVRLYVASCSAVLWLGLVCAASLGRLDVLAHPARLAPLLGMVVAVEALVVRERNRGRSKLQSFSATAHIAAAIIFGPAVAALLACVGVVVVDGLQGAPRRVVLMNSAMFGCAIGLAGIVFELAGGTVGTVSSGDFVPLLLLIAVRFAVNEFMLGVVVALDSGARFGDLMRDQLRDQVREALGSELGQGCLGVLLAYVFTSGTWVILPFLVPLLGALYQSEANFERLKSETADVLHQLATAIDERDRNTADHTQRVASYVERFAKAIALGERETARLVQAARYHDLGKIVVDVATLSKPERLDEEELQAIRRHPRLSARLLAPFHFAQEIALFAELHHERYDGRGYYGVPRQDIPIEAHVLIVADSFDAMTSNRPYRSGLPIADALAELEANAGTQFHPLVATTFAAVVGGDDLEAAVGHERLAALRAEFSAVPVVDLGWLRGLPKPSSITVVLASITLACAGINEVPVGVTASAAVATLAFGSLTLAELLLYQRRKRHALRALERGASPAEALAAGGVAGWAAWLVPDPRHDTYTPWPITWPIHDPDLAHAAALALRPTIDQARARLSSGRYISIAAPNESGARLAVGAPVCPSRFDLALIECVASSALPRRPDARELARSAPEQRDTRDLVTGVISVELGLFEAVRRAAGQLCAQRVVQDASRRIEELLRAEDQLARLSDDRFAIAVMAASQEQLDRISSRITSALRDVPVPRGSGEPRPTVRAALMPEALGDAMLAEAIQCIDSAVERRKAA
jgi:HD-GYP domain-containing protein (c-di-GMP phosphodiesterase class II)/GGDEF domain-containing protein